jgi:hypothetical protein
MGILFTSSKPSPPRYIVRNTVQVFVTFLPRRPMIVSVEFVDKVTLRQAYLGAVGWVASTNIITLIIHISSRLPPPPPLPPGRVPGGGSAISLQRSAAELSLALRCNVKLHFKSWIFPSLTVDLCMYSVNKQQHKTQHVRQNKRNYHSNLSKLRMSSRSPADPNDHGTQMFRHSKCSPKQYLNIGISTIPYFNQFGRWM